MLMVARIASAFGNHVHESYVAVVPNNNAAREQLCYCRSSNASSNKTSSLFMLSQLIFCSPSSAVNVIAYVTVLEG
jgi:hypothetical protein